MAREEENEVAIFFWKTNAKMDPKNFEEDAMVDVTLCLHRIPPYCALPGHTKTYITEPLPCCVPMTKC